jgi:hypothetical protein
MAFPFVRSAAGESECGPGQVWTLSKGLLIGLPMSVTIQTRAGAAGQPRQLDPAGMYSPFITRVSAPSLA